MCHASVCVCAFLRLDFPKKWISVFLLIPCKTAKKGGTPKKDTPKSVHKTVAVTHFGHHGVSGIERSQTLPVTQIMFALLRLKPLVPKFETNRTIERSLLQCRPRINQAVDSDNPWGGSYQGHPTLPKIVLRSISAPATTSTEKVLVWKKNARGIE